MKTLLLAAAAVAIAILPANAADVQVKMLNKGAKGMMVFEPDLVKVQPGDTVTFVATDPGHDAQSVPGMLPEGAQPFEGKIGKDLTVTFTQPGVYGVKCKPHYSMGMVALIVVGEPTNLAEASEVKHPGKAKKVFTELLAQAQ